MSEPTAKQKQDLATFEDLAKQFQLMRQQFPAFRLLLEHVDGEIAASDKDWEKTTKDDFDYKRGEKAARVEIRRWLGSYLDKKLSDG